MKKLVYTQGSAPIIFIIAGLVALGGVGAILLYVMNNGDEEVNLSAEIEQSANETAEQAQTNGWPGVWVEDGMPEYPHGELTKAREGRSHAWGAQITLETTDSLADVKSFFDSEMSARGYVDAFASMPVTEYSASGQYRNDEATLSLQAARIGVGPKNKVTLIYSDKSKVQ